MAGFGRGWPTGWPAGAPAGLVPDINLLICSTINLFQPWIIELFLAGTLSGVGCSSPVGWFNTGMGPGNYVTIVKVIFPLNPSPFPKRPPCLAI